MPKSEINLSTRNKIADPMSTIQRSTVNGQTVSPRVMASAKEALCLFLRPFRMCLSRRVTISSPPPSLDVTRLNDPLLALGEGERSHDLLESCVVRRQPLALGGTGHSEDGGSSEFELKYLLKAAAALEISTWQPILADRRSLLCKHKRHRALFIIQPRFY